MKVIVFGSRAGALESVEFMPDTVVNRVDMPVFLPEGYGYALQVGVAVRIGRLGKGIPSRFARRHIDAVGTAALMMPSVADATATPAVALAGVFDGALSLLWHDLATDEPLPPTLCACAVKTDSNGASVDAAVTTQVPTGVFEQAVEVVSTMVTLKSGDIVVVKHGTEQVNVAVDDMIDLQLPQYNIEKILKIK